MHFFTTIAYCKEYKNSDNIKSETLICTEGWGYVSATHPKLQQWYRVQAFCNEGIQDCLVCVLFIHSKGQTDPKAR